MVCSLQADTKSRGSSFCRKDPLKLQNEDPRLNGSICSLQADTKSRGSSFCRKDPLKLQNEDPRLNGLFATS